MSEVFKDKTTKELVEKKLDYMKQGVQLCIEAYGPTPFHDYVELLMTNGHKNVSTELKRRIGLDRMRTNRGLVRLALAVRGEK